MTSDMQDQITLLDRLDAEQTEVIRALDDLNLKVEQAIRDWSCPVGNSDS